MKILFDAAVVRCFLLTLLGLLVFTQISRAEDETTKETPSPATYQLLDAALARCDILDRLPSIAVTLVAGHCVVIWNGGRTIRYDAAIVVSTVVELRQLRSVQLPLFVARNGRTWTFARGSQESQLYRDVWEFSHVTGERYWIAHVGSQAYFISFDPHGWRTIPIVGPVSLQGRIPLFVVSEHEGQFVRWGENTIGPFKKVERIHRTGNEVHIAVAGRLNLIRFIEGED